MKRLISACATFGVIPSAIAAFAFAVLFGGVERAAAQGSAYDLLGFGVPVLSANPVLEAMGGVGAASSSQRIISDQNPASWTWLDRTRFDLSGRYDQTSADFGPLHDQQHMVRIDGLTFGTPFWAAGSGALSLGYVSLTNASSKLATSDSLGTTTSVSNGGANMLFLGLAARPLNWLSVGGRIDLIVGDIRHQDHVVFHDAQADSAEFERDYTFSGVRPTIGLQFIGDSVGLDGLVVGASYSAAASLTSTRETIITPINSTLDTTIDIGGVGSYPAQLNLGVSYRLGQRVRAEADFVSQAFSSAYVYSPSSASGDTMLRNGTRISVGIERAANVAGEYGTSYGLDKWALRFGLSYSQLPFIAGAAKGVNEYAFSAGVGVPVGFESLINFTFVGGQRSPVVTGEAPKELFMRLGASVSLSERWFAPTRRD